MGEQMTSVRSLLRLSCVAFLAAVGASCLVGRVWMVDYKFETSALRSASGSETGLSASRAGEDIDLIAMDERAEFSFRVESGRIGVSIQNRSTEPLSLYVADASYVDPSGRTHGLLFLSNKKLVQDRALEVGPRSTIELSLWPKDWNHGWYKGRPSVWSGDSPLGGSTIEETTREKALEKRAQDIGKGFEIALPLGISDERVTYRFRFMVSELVARRTWWA